MKTPKINRYPFGILPNNKFICIFHLCKGFLNRFLKSGKRFVKGQIFYKLSHDKKIL